MNVSQTAIFERLRKKLHVNQNAALDRAVRKISENPKIGELKKGDLNDVRVYKFNMINHQMLLAYIETRHEIILIYFGSHENFYRDLKKNVK